jgi:hypothetical protein
MKMVKCFRFELINLMAGSLDTPDSEHLI